MTKRKRAAAMMLACLAFLIFCGVPFQQAHALAVTSTAVIAIIIAALAAMGITFSMTGGYKTLTNWLSEQIDEAGLDFSGVRYGVNNQGQILINNAFLQRVRALGLYLVSEFGLIDGGAVNVQSSGTISGNLYGYGTPMQFNAVKGSNVYTIIASSPATVILCWTSLDNRDSVRPVIVSSVPFSVTTYVLYNGQETAVVNYESIHITDTDSDYYIWFNNSIHTQWRVSGSDNYKYIFEDYVINRIAVTSNSEAMEVANLWFGNSASTVGSLDIVTGVIDIPSTSDIDGMGGVIDLPVDWGATLGEIITDIPGLVLDDDLAGNTTLDLEAEGDVADSIDQSATSSEVISANPDDYSVSGLSEVFPFCIPFDLYDFLECLAAEPEAPSVTWRFYVPRICDETIEIDLSEFDAAAQVLRTMELLLFCVGLAFVTRHLLRG